MGIWMEFRCENRGESSADPVPPNYEDRCWSHNNAGPMMEANDTNADVLHTLKLMGDEAKKAGWIKTKAGWRCPYCAAKC